MDKAFSRNRVIRSVSDTGLPSQTHEDEEEDVEEALVVFEVVLDLVVGLVTGTRLLRGMGDNGAMGAVLSGTREMEELPCLNS